MAYQINKTDGTVVSTVADGQIDTLSTDLTLIGKNYSGFGESINENFIKLLENFADTTQPTNPIRGQIWYDSSESKLKVYSGTEFLPVSSATIANTQPASLGVGDLWFNDADKQLYFYDGTTTILLAPAYSASQGLSGIRVQNVLDRQNQTRVITTLYNNGTLLGIFAKDAFSLKEEILGFSGDVIPGFNVGNLLTTINGVSTPLKFNVTVTNSDSLGGQLASKYVRNDSTNAVNGLLRVTVDPGIEIGSAGQLTLRVDNGNVQIINSASERNMVFEVRKGINPETAITINSSTRAVDIYSTYPDSSVYMGGNLTVAGNMTVEGTVTTINTATMTIEDKNIELGKLESPTNTTADGGGITLKGNSDHTLTWTDASRAWNSSEHINLVSNPALLAPAFKINGITVLSENSLGDFITSIPGVTSFGKQNIIRVGPGLATNLANTYIKIEDNTISTEQVDQDLELAPNGTGNIALIGTPKITGLSDPTQSLDAANKEYVDRTVESTAIVFSMDLTDGKPNAYIVDNILNNLAPVSEHRNGTQARILCTLLSNSSTILDINSLVTQDKTTIFRTDAGGAAPAVTDVAINNASVAGAPITTTRIIKIFEIENSVWTWKTDSLLPA